MDKIVISAISFIIKLRRMFSSALVQNGLTSAAVSGLVDQLREAGRDEWHWFELNKSLIYNLSTEQTRNMLGWSRSGQVSSLLYSYHMLLDRRIHSHSYTHSICYSALLLFSYG